MDEEFVHEVESVKRSFFARVLGIPATKDIADKDSYSVNANVILLDLAKEPAIKEKGNSLRIEFEDKRVLLVHAQDGLYYAFENKCRHGKRRLDYVPGTNTVQCCSIGKTTYDFTGRVVYGNVKTKLHSYALEVTENTIKIKL